MGSLHIVRENFGRTVFNGENTPPRETDEKAFTERIRTDENGSTEIGTEDIVFDTVFRSRP